MSSFPQFVLLPPELQSKIWTSFLPEPRIIDLYAHKTSSSAQQIPNHPSSITSPNSESTSETASDLLPPSWTWVHCHTERLYTSPQPFQPLLHVCREARRLVLSHFVRINSDMEVRAPETPLARAMRFPHFGLINSDTEVDAPGAAHDGVTHFTPLETYSRPNDTPEEVRAQRKQGRFYLETLKGSRPFALLDPKADIVFLQDPPRQRNPWEGDVVSSLATLVRWLDGAVLQNLRSLAIPYYTWHKSRILGILHLLLEFKELEELYVSFLGGVPGVGGSMGGWADEEAVVELGGHVTEVGEEVRGDVEGLKRKFPEWQKPRVQIVKHRGFLTKELDG